MSKGMGDNFSSTLLVVEDDENDLFFLDRTIRKAGIENPIQVARSGLEAIEYLSGTGSFADRQQFPLPSLVFLDLHLPGKSGLEVLSWIRKQPELNEVVVVLLTASKEEAAISAAYEIGANCYLVKPPTGESLNVLLEALDLYSLQINRSAD